MVDTDSDLEAYLYEEIGCLCLYCREERKEFIVRACNSHYELLAALEAIMNGVLGGRTQGAHYFIDSALIGQINDAIAKAKGET